MNLSTNLTQLVTSDPNFNPKASYLLAVSGGVDSMVLLHCFKTLGLNLEVAHVNYGLRGVESDQDEALVKEYCNSHHIPFQLLRVQEQADMELDIKATGIQEKARLIRYHWFKKILLNKPDTLLVTAHHANDQFETMMLFLLRGTGLKGLKGMRNFNKQHWRPLLSVPKSELEEYAQQQQVPYRLDASNLENKYLRNQVRNIIAPAIEKVKNDFLPAFILSAKNLSDSLSLEEQLLSYFFEQNKTLVGAYTCFEFAKINAFENPSILFFKLFEPYGFNRVQTDMLWDLANKANEQGSILSESHQLNLNRKVFYLKAQQEESSFKLTIDSLPFQFTYDDYSYELAIEPWNKNDSFSSDFLYIDIRQISLPLIIRKVKQGDKFFPLGLTHQQLVSDFLINRKSSIADKAASLLLLDSKQTLALLPWRIDNRYRLADKVDKVLRIKIKKAGT